jgi:hypothetical protein
MQWHAMVINQIWWVGSFVVTAAVCGGFGLGYGLAASRAAAEMHRTTDYLKSLIARMEVEDGFNDQPASPTIN